MQCEEDWAVMHALHQRHGWSIARIAREFDVSWRTARRYARAETVPRYRPRTRPAELSPTQAAHVTRRLGTHPELRATTLYREVQELVIRGQPSCTSPNPSCHSSPSSSASHLYATCHDT
jgi:hypothetical protein